MEWLGQVGFAASSVLALTVAKWIVMEGNPSVPAACE
jgi:hypothetical protein